MSKVSNLFASALVAQKFLNLIVLEICLVYDHVQKHDEASEDAFIKLKSL